MDIKGMNKAKILSALYNNSKPLGLGFLQVESVNMTESDAQKILDSGETYFDYLKGRVMKIDISGNDLCGHLYDRDNGHGECERIINSI